MFSMIMLAGSESVLDRPSISRCFGVTLLKIDFACSGQRIYFESLLGLWSVGSITSYSILRLPFEYLRFLTWQLLQSFMSDASFYTRLNLDLVFLITMYCWSSF